MSVGLNTSIGNVREHADLGCISNAVGSFGKHSIHIGSETVLYTSEFSGTSDIPQKSLHQRRIAVYKTNG